MSQQKPLGQPVEAPVEASVETKAQAEVLAEVWAAVPLGAGAALMVRAMPDADDLVVIRAAARPLLDLLAQRGLLAPERAPEGD